MSPDAFGRFLAGENGIVTLDTVALANLPAQPLPDDRLVIHARLGERAEKPAALDELSLAFDMPRWFGHNWDALEDCLTDLEWLPRHGIILIMEGTLATAEDTSTLMDILRDTCDFWEGESRPFHVALDARLAAASR